MFGKKKVRIIGLDIGSRTLKVAEVEQNKQLYVLKRFGIMDIAPGLIEEGMIKNPVAVADTIRKLFREAKIKDQNVAISIGGYSIIVKTISVDKANEGKLKETIQFEAEQYIPFDISDVNLDYQVLGDDESSQGRINVLLVAAKKEVVTDYINLVRMAKLLPRIVDVDAFAIQNIYEVNYEGDENVALIDIGATKTTINILKNKVSVLIRDVALGCGQINQQIVSRLGCTIEEAEEKYHGNEDNADVMEIVSSVVSGWCSEIRRALDFFYSTYPGDHIKKLFLSGGGARIEKFRRLLAEEASSDVEILNPFENVSTTLDPQYMEKIAPQAALCMGLALRKVDDR